MKNESKKHIKHLKDISKFSRRNAYDKLLISYDDYIDSCYRRYVLESKAKNIKCRVKKTLYFDTALRFVRKR